MKNRKSILNVSLSIFLILVCVFPIALFIYRFLNHSVPILFNIVSSSILLIGGLGLLFIYYGHRIIGMLLIFLNLIMFCIKGIVYEQNIFNTFYFWSFTFVLIYFVIDEFKRKRTQR